MGLGFHNVHIGTYDKDGKIIESTSTENEEVKQKVTYIS